MRLSSSTAVSARRPAERPLSEHRHRAARGGANDLQRRAADPDLAARPAVLGEGRRVRTVDHEVRPIAFGRHRVVAARLADAIEARARQHMDRGVVEEAAVRRRLRDRQVRHADRLPLARRQHLLGHGAVEALAAPPESGEPDLAAEKLGEELIDSGPAERLRVTGRKAHPKLSVRRGLGADLKQPPPELRALRAGDLAGFDVDQRVGPVPLDARRADRGGAEALPEQGFHRVTPDRLETSCDHLRAFAPTGRENERRPRGRPGAPPFSRPKGTPEADRRRSDDPRFRIDPWGGKARPVHAPRPLGRPRFRERRR